MTDTNSTSPGFVHLRVRSAYSLLAGALPIKRLATLAVTDDLPALAITDSGNLFGALEFAVKMTGEGVQPIIGCTLAIDCEEGGEEASTNAESGHSAMAAKTGSLRSLPEVVLLASNEAGYQNLMWLSSQSFLGSDGVAQPRITFSQLKERHDGLIVLTGGLNGLIDTPLRDQIPERARDRLLRLKSVFGDRLYIEIQRHNTQAQRAVEPALVTLAYELEIALVATNDCHFPGDADFEAHDALMCIEGGHLVSQDQRPRLTPEHRFKSREEMIALFADLPEATANSVEIARRCSYWPQPADPMLPSFGEGDEAAELRNAAFAGLESRLNTQPLAEGHSREAYFERLEI